MIASVTEITATEIASAKFNLMADGEGDPRGRRRISIWCGRRVNLQPGEPTDIQRKKLNSTTTIVQ